MIDVATECFDGYCQDAGTSAAFCGCWNNGQDINVDTCECMPLNLEQACSAVNLDEFDPNSYDCATATALVSDFCN